LTENSAAFEPDDGYVLQMRSLMRVDFSLTAIGKSGGQQFHGEAYLYSRYYTLNANDPQNKNSNIARPETKYFYPGFQIGGPVILPHTGFTGVVTRCSFSLVPSTTSKTSTTASITQ